MAINCVDVQNRYKRLEGQLKGVGRMINEERDAIDIVNQISAVRAGLGKLAAEILREESNGCFQKKSDKERLEAFETLVDSFFKIN